MAGMLNGKWTLLTSLFTSICMFLALRFCTKSSEILGIDYSNGTLSAGKALKQYIMGFNIQIEVNSEVSSVHFHLTYEPILLQFWIILHSSRKQGFWRVVFFFDFSLQARAFVRSPRSRSTSRTVTRAWRNSWWTRWAGIVARSSSPPSRPRPWPTMIPTIHCSTPSGLRTSRSL